MQADREYMVTMIQSLSKISEPCQAGVQRRSFTPEYRLGAEYVKEQMKKAGLVVFEDGIGNIYGRLEGEEDLPAICSGSHLDTVKCAGAYDGIAGVVCALEAARMIRKSGRPLKHPYMVFGTIEEEGTRFEQVTLGSKYMAGLLDADRIAGFRDAETGQDFGQILNAYRPAAQVGALRQDQVQAVVEVHGEQGPVLADQGLDIGVVDRIVGITWLEVTISGRAGHSGTVPMKNRRDAGVEAARMITWLYDQMCERYNGLATLTAGTWALDPGSANCIPGECRFTLDIRSGDRKLMDEIVDMVKDYRIDLSGMDVRVETVSDKDPTFLDGQIGEMIRESSEERGYSCRHLDSGAGHDSMVFAQKWPAAMIFLPNQGGISHNPDEYITPEDMKKGAEVLYDTIRRIDENM